GLRGAGRRGRRAGGPPPARPSPEAPPRPLLGSAGRQDGAGRDHPRVRGARGHGRDGPARRVLGRALRRRVSARGPAHGRRHRSHDPGRRRGGQPRVRPRGGAGRRADAARVALGRSRGTAGDRAPAAVPERSPPARRPRRLDRGRGLPGRRAPL
ncbi:MAG: Nudix hydrolase family protein, partial [uncultured Rubrobacteraceae bacterium]